MGGVRPQLALRPEVRYPGGPFLKPYRTRDVGPRDVARLIEGLPQGRYYWHVEAEREITPPDEDWWFSDGEYLSAFGPTAYFEIIPTLSLGAARDYTRVVLRDELYRGAGRDATIRCARLNLLRAYCRFKLWAGNLVISGKGPIFYTDDVNDRYFHYRFRVTFRDEYCRYVNKGRGCKKKWVRRWRG